MHQQSTKILRTEIGATIHLLTRLCVYSVKTCSDRTLEEVTTGDAFLALDDSVNKTTICENCGSDGRFASSIKAVDDDVWRRWRLLL